MPRMDRWALVRDECLEAVIGWESGRATKVWFGRGRGSCSGRSSFLSRIAWIAEEPFDRLFGIARLLISSSPDGKWTLAHRYPQSLPCLSRRKAHIGYHGDLVI